MFRIYTERKHGFENEARQIMSEIKGFLGIEGVTGVRYLNRYDIENINEGTAKSAAIRIFSEPQSDTCYFEHIPLEKDDTIIAWEYLPGQYDQRADSAMQCLSILMSGLKSAGAGAVGELRARLIRLGSSRWRCRFACAIRQAIARTLLRKPYVCLPHSLLHFFANC